eukprot:3374740-Pleurochrysis_carterae.AAC.1
MPRRLFGAHSAAFDAAGCPAAVSTAKTPAKGVRPAETNAHAAAADANHDDDNAAPAPDALATSAGDIAIPALAAGRQTAFYELKCIQLHHFKAVLPDGQIAQLPREGGGAEAGGKLQNAIITCYNTAPKVEVRAMTLDRSPQYGCCCALSAPARTFSTCCQRCGQLHSPSLRRPLPRLRL